MNCDTCIYLGSQTVGGIPSLQGTTQPQHNVCRRNAPGARGWPVIPFPDTDWCGQYKPKTPPERGTCKDCKHFDGVADCREQPRPVYADRLHSIVVFPPVFETDWCSRWEAKP